MDKYKIPREKECRKCSYDITKYQNREEGQKYHGQKLLSKDVTEFRNTLKIG